MCCVCGLVLLKEKYGNQINCFLRNHFFYPWTMTKPSLSKFNILLSFAPFPKQGYVLDGNFSTCLLGRQTMFLYTMLSFWMRMYDRPKLHFSLTNFFFTIVILLLCHKSIGYIHILLQKKVTCYFILVCCCKKGSLVFISLWKESGGSSGDQTLIVHYIR